MALMDCPECGREVSSRAAACPVCAYPMAPGARRIRSRTESGTPKEQWWRTALPIVGRIAVASILLAGAVEEESVAALIGASLIGVSAIPAWYRHKIERLRARGAGPAVDARLEERMAEMDDRYREQMAQLEQMHTGQIADLEERLDFTERLLTKQRAQTGPG